MNLGNYKVPKADPVNFADCFNLITQNRLKIMLDDGKINSLVVLYSRSTEVVLLLETYLAIWNYRTKVASNEKTLFGILENEFPAAILFDLPYDYMSELKLLEDLRKCGEFRNIPILVLSGHARRSDADMAFAAGASEYFLKPLNFDYLENRLNLYSLRNLNQNSLEGIV